MAKKPKKVAKKRHITKKTGSVKTITMADEQAKTEAITQWLRTVD